MSSKSKAPATSVNTISTPYETSALRKGLRSFLNQPVENPAAPGVKRLGAYKYGVYAFYDYDDEPIYVGQTREQLSSRIGRHLTNQRTDAVAMNVLDPYEVYAIAVWPVPEFQNRKTSDPEVKTYMDDLEAAVFEKLLKESKFGAVLNEKVPVSDRKVKLPECVKSIIVDDKVRELRGHPDIRLARRAVTISRLAQVISEREVQPGLRRTLLIQAERLRWLAEQRYKPFETEAQKDDKEAGGEE
ncbi:MAG: GIY-YIG nuclease family protein [Alphaproteobacteria bacterium]|nr:GIY-YIG nuclease family protein [Alphaproteobacteria bacterium]